MQNEMMEVDDDVVDAAISPHHKPDLSGPPLKLPLLRCYIESGTFISFDDNEGKICYGRIVSTASMATTGLMEINIFQELGSLKDTIPELQITYLHNAYIDVPELVQMASTIRLPPSCITGLIFVFRKDDIVNGVYPCEGVEFCFVLRYRLMDNNTTIIPIEECLPFPCLYHHSGITISCAKRVFKALYAVRKTVTHLMMRSWKNMGRRFIQGSDHVSIPIEAWIFFSKFVVKKGMKIYGPFPKSHKHYQTRRFLDINAVRVHSFVEVIQFTTRVHFQIFDSLFGKYVRYGTLKPKPKVLLTVLSALHDHMYHMGSGLFSSHYKFKRRGNTDWGVDLTYDVGNENLFVKLVCLSCRT